MSRRWQSKQSHLPVIAKSKLRLRLARKIFIIVLLMLIKKSIEEILKEGQFTFIKFKIARCKIILVLAFVKYYKLKCILLYKKINYGAKNYPRAGDEHSY